GQEGSDAVRPRLAVDVAVVVLVAVEGDERAARLRRPGPQEVVEHLLPGGGVDGGGLGQDAVEVEQAGADAVREAEHGPVATRYHRGRVKRRAGRPSPGLLLLLTSSSPGRR